MMVLLEERKGKENERMATAKREAWADAVDPWRQFFLAPKFPSEQVGIHPMPTPENLHALEKDREGKKIYKKKKCPLYEV